jgi:hypothetical protein
MDTVNRNITKSVIDNGTDADVRVHENLLEIMINNLSFHVISE